MPLQFLVILLLPCDKYVVVDTQVNCGGDLDSM